MNTKFDTELPEELVKELILSEARGTTGTPTPLPRPKKIEELFSLAGDKDIELNLNQIIIGIWRKYDEIWKRHTVQDVIRDMIKQGRLRRTRQGFFSVK